MIRRNLALGWALLQKGDDLWVDFSGPTEIYHLLRFSVVMGIIPFTGYLIYYTWIGKIWCWWPWMQSTMPFMRGTMCAVLQWVFFATFPVLCSFVLEFLFYRRPALDVNSCVVVITYSMLPLLPAALLVGVPKVNQVLPLLSGAAFVYFLFFGFRNHMNLNWSRAAVFTSITFVLFAMIRQAFVFVIGY